MIYKVKMTPEALDEVEQAYLWIRRDSPDRALKWRAGLTDTIDSLSQHPTRCARAPEAAKFKQEIRQLLYGKRSGVYRILFTIEGDLVTVLHVRHAARQFLEP